MASKHIHKLKKYTYKNGEQVYFCVKDCKFKVVVGQALGKIVECWKCSKPFEMTSYSIRLAKPHCNDCITSKDNAHQFVIPKGRINEIADTMDSLKLRLASKASKSVEDVPEDLL